MAKNKKTEKILHVSRYKTYILISIVDAAAASFVSYPATLSSDKFINGGRDGRDGREGRDGRDGTVGRDERDGTGGTGGTGREGREGDVPPIL